MTSFPPTSAPRNEGVLQNAISLAFEIIIFNEQCTIGLCLFHM
jgi:hypothetical protein